MNARLNRPPTLSAQTVPEPSRSLDDLLSDIDSAVKQSGFVPPVGATGYPVPQAFYLSGATGKSVAAPTISRRDDEPFAVCDLSIAWRSMRARWFFVGPGRLVESQANCLKRALRDTQEEMPLGSKSLLGAITAHQDGVQYRSGVNVWFLLDRRIAWTLERTVADLLQGVLRGRL